jgi:hypothetical protein
MVLDAYGAYPHHGFRRIFDVVINTQVAEAQFPRWNDFFETVGHRIPYSAIPYANNEEWVNHRLQHVPRISVELEK